MIIRVLGGNGAGKSHLVHSVLAQYAHKTEELDCVFCEGGQALQNVVVMGHYRIANGGMDTIPSGHRLDKAYESILQFVAAQWHVLYEVSAMKDGPRRLLEICHLVETRAILLTPSDDERVASVRARGHNIREDLIRSSGRKAEKTTRELCAGGVPILVLDRAAALRRVLEHLRSPAK